MARAALADFGVSRDAHLHRADAGGRRDEVRSGVAHHTWNTATGRDLASGQHRAAQSGPVHNRAVHNRAVQNGSGTARPRPLHDRSGRARRRAVGPPDLAGPPKEVPPNS